MNSLKWLLLAFVFTILGFSPITAKTSNPPLKVEWESFYANFTPSGPFGKGRMIGVGTRLQAHKRLAIGFSLAYGYATWNVNPNWDMKWFPFIGSMTYHLSPTVWGLRPYVGPFASYNLMSSQFERPLFGWGFLVGFVYPWKKNVWLYVEYQKHTLTDSKVDVDLNPTVMKFGVKVPGSVFGGKKDYRRKF